MAWSKFKIPQEQIFPNICLIGVRETENLTGSCEFLCVYFGQRVNVRLFSVGID